MKNPDRSELEKFRPYRVKSYADGGFSVTSEKLVRELPGEEYKFPVLGVVSRMALAHEIENFLNGVREKHGR